MATMAGKRDYYEVLGVDRSASLDGIRKAYRKLALKYHPDRNQNDPGAVDKFKEATEAYEVLSDQGKRNSYDQFGHAGVGQGQPGAGGFDFGGAAFRDFEDIFGGFGDIFGELFGASGMGRSGGRRTRARRGQDLRYDMEIELGEAFRGVEKAIEVPRQTACAKCDGTGSAKGSKPQTCPECQGSGQLRYSQGFISIAKPCYRCGGTGSYITNPCSSCNGSGRTVTHGNVSVRIPAGSDTGLKLRVPGEGEAGMNGGPPGDLYIFLSLKPHPLFQRDGDDLLCDVPISFSQAALGEAKLTVPTMDKRVNIKIPAGTQTGKIFRVRGVGMPSLRGNRIGDLLVRIRVETPAKLTPKQRDLFEQLAEVSGADPNPYDSFLGKVKDVLGL